jgi:hypothetical protein
MIPLDFKVSGKAARIALSLVAGVLLACCWACGGGTTATSAPATPTPPAKPVSVGSSVQTLHNLQASGGWIGYGEYPPAYSTCTSCGSGVTWSLGQQVKTPSLSGSSAQFNIAGTQPYSDVLWTNALIGQKTTQAIPDSNHTLIPSLHNFTYDVYFYTDNLPLAQVLEFDVNLYSNGHSLTWGNQCRIINGQMWDIWDNVNTRWVSTGIPCNPQNASWNHLIIEVQRDSDDSLLYKSITLNGIKADVNQTYPHGTAPSGWWGITTNFQMDGDQHQTPYSVLLDNFNFSYY